MANSRNQTKDRPAPAAAPVKAEAPKSTGLTRIGAIEQGLLSRLPTIQEMLPAEQAGKANWFVKRALLTFHLAQWPLNVCTPASYITAVVAGAEIGLPIDGKLGFAVPYKNGELSEKAGQPVYEAKFQPSYVGLSMVAMRSGQISRISATLVCEKDHFEHGRSGDKCFLEHRWTLDDRGPLIGAYAIVTFPDGTWVYELMSEAELAKVASTSKANRPDSPWKQWPGEMRRKTVIKRALKLYCSDPGFVLASQLDDEEFVEPVAGPVPQVRRSAASTTAIPGVWSPPGPSVDDELRRFADSVVNGGPDPEAEAPAADAESQEPAADPVGLEDLWNDLSMRLDNASAAEIDGVQKWALQSFPMAEHGRIAEACKARRAELGEAAG